MSKLTAKPKAPLPEINWTIAEVCVVLLWKLRPKGLKLGFRDLGGIPVDRVLVEERLTDRIIYRWVDPDQVVLENARRHLATGEKPGLYEAQGRYMKLLGVLLWKLAKDGITLGQWDRDAVPDDKVLHMAGTADRVVYSFISRQDAKRMQAQSETHEGLSIVEAIRR